MKVRRIILTAAYSAIIAFLALCRSGNGDGEVFPPPDPVFAKMVPYTNLRKTSFNQALQILSQQAGMPIRPDWSALSRMGMGSDDLVTARYSDCTFERALQLVLANADGSSLRLGYRIKDGSIVVSTYADSMPELICRVYPVGDLIEQMETSDSVGSFAGSVITYRLWRFRWQRPHEFFTSYVDFQLNSLASASLPRDGPQLRAWVIWWFLESRMAEHDWQTATVRRSVRIAGDRIVLVALPQVQKAFAGILQQLRRHEEPLYPEKLLRWPALGEADW